MVEAPNHAGQEPMRVVQAPAEAPQEPVPLIQALIETPQEPVPLIQALAEAPGHDALEFVTADEDPQQAAPQARSENVPEAETRTLDFAAERKDLSILMATLKVSYSAGAERVVSAFSFAVPPLSSSA